MVSACLAGLPCRYDGRTNFKPEVAELAASGLAVPVCPEQLGGLPTPRTPSERRGDSVIMADGTDVTVEFRAGAEAALYIAEEYQQLPQFLLPGLTDVGADQQFHSRLQNPVHVAVDREIIISANQLLS